MDVTGELMMILNKQVKITESLMGDKKGADALVDKNIIKSPNSTFGENTQSKLTPSERKKAGEVSSIFITKFFEEQRKRQPDSKLQTLTGSKSSDGKGLTGISGISGDLGKGKDNAEKKSSGLWALLAGLLPWAVKLVSRMAGFIKKIVGKLATTVKKLFGKIGSIVKKLFSSLKNSKWYKAISGFVKNAISKIGKLFSNIKSKIVGLFRFLGKRVGALWGTIKASKAFKLLGGVFKKIKDVIASFFQGIKNKIMGVVKAVTKGVSSVIPGAAKKAATVVKGAAKGVSKVGGSVINKAGSIVKGGAKIAAKGAAVVGGTAIAAGKAVAGAPAKAAKAGLAKFAKGIVKSSGGMFKLMGKLAKIPVIAPLIEGFFAKKDINQMQEKVAKGEMTVAEMQKQAGARVITGIGATAGTIAGGVLGALGGGPITSLLGAVAGDWAGRKLGELFVEHVMPKKYAKSIGAFVTKTAPPKEMQDFIIKGSKVYPFNNKDEIMGVKTGGAIDDFMKRGAMKVRGAMRNVISKRGAPNQSMDTLVRVNMASIQYLKAIANNTALMVRAIGGIGGGQSGPTIVNMSSPSTPQSSGSSLAPIGNNRSAYGDSPYALG